MMAHPFEFPFEPYDIQVQLMEKAYYTYENSKHALLESPTGTGKSLSLICSALKWLHDYQTSLKKSLEDKKIALEEKIELLRKEEENSGDWLSVQTKRQDEHRELAEVTRQLERIQKLEAKSKARKHAKLHDNPLENYSVMTSKTSGIDNLENSIQLSGSQGSTSVDEPEEHDKKATDNEEDHVRPKIYYASRTHSQLSQFINEIKQTDFANSDDKLPVKVVPLASRANLCVNPDVVKLKDPSAINERCVELQRETKSEKKCPYIKSKQINQLKEEVLSQVQDIEDIVRLGRKLGSCPYYATRSAIPESDVVVLPYNNLLHHETRKASSLDLKDSIVIVDEAHNILETICSIHSVSITGKQLIGSHTILSRYYKKYHNRMSPKNAELIKNIVQCITALLKFLNDPKNHITDYEFPKGIEIEGDHCKVAETNQEQRSHDEIMIGVTKFIGAACVERFNIFKIIDYFNRSQLARKLLGFFRQDCTLDLTLDLSEVSNKTNSPKSKKRKVLLKQNVATTNQIAPNEEPTSLTFLNGNSKELKKHDIEQSSSYPIYCLVEFFKSLTSLASDGKVLIDFIRGDVQKSTLKFVLLNPASQFKQMVQESRSIVLAGGTMQPFNEFTDLLFDPLGVTKDKIEVFSCGHVIPAKQLYAATLYYGCTGKPLELSFKTKSSFEVLDEYGKTVQNISKISPGGLVCFFPSYDYEQICYNRWKHTGVIASIETKSKIVLREPRQTSQLKPVFEEYARAIEKGSTKGRGAMLMCVVGGKMSEGINFNDDLGRCIIMIGLPYANIKSGELQQKMSYYDRTCKKKENPGEATQSSAGQQYYENLCIKGINQSIGRAIRHRNDFSAIILLDQRYSCKTSIRNGLPGWIRGSMVDHERFGPLYSQLGTFFKSQIS